MIQGRYRDSVRGSDGCLLRQGDWASNSIAAPAWPLVAGLLKRDARAHGILYGAVGAGDKRWNRRPPFPDPKRTRLEQERARAPVGPEDMCFLAPGGAESLEPTKVLQIRFRISFPDRRVDLREFGLFGGLATAIADSGSLINHVVHPELHLRAGQVLERTVRLTLGATGDDKEPERGPVVRIPIDVGDGLPDLDHPMAGEPVEILSGAGRELADLLQGQGIATIGQLAAAETGGLPAPARPAQARARLGLGVLAQIKPVPDLAALPVALVLETPAKELTQRLASDSHGGTPREIRVLQEQLRMLDLVFGKSLSPFTLGRLLGDG